MALNATKYVIVTDVIARLNLADMTEKKKAEAELE